MNMNEKLKYTADHHGYEAQAGQLVEEMAELTVALHKWKRLESGDLLADAEKIVKARESIIEEMADVENVMEQLKYLMGCNSDVFLARIRKADREIARIKGYGESV